MNAKTDVLIVGGGTGGCAAALAAARCGLDVMLVEETSWIGGQFTSQGVPPDEHGWIERFGCTASYRRLRQDIRDYYRRHYPLTGAARASEHLNPGNGWVSPLCHEPKVAHAVLRATMAPYVSAGRLRILDRSRCVALDTSGDWIRGATVESDGDRVEIDARWFIDATELGDLLPISGAEFVTGAESRSGNVQAFSWCFAMEHFAGQDHRIARPAKYEYWCDYVPALTPPWPGRLLDWTTPNPRTMQPNRYRFEPHGEQAKAFSGLWSYRRLLDRSLFTEGFFPSDRCLVNWPLIDYLDGELCTATAEDRARFLAEAREMSLCVFYWLQNDAPRADGGSGWPGLRLCGDALGTADGFAMAPYIRESRRIYALKTIVEEDVSAACRDRAEPYRDSVGIGYYRIDLHPSTGGDNYLDVAALPFRIPLGALLPVRMRNLLPAAKNIGTTHITNGCYRLHPVEWNIGEVAGLLAAWCSRHGIEPHQVAGDFEEFQTMLGREGIELAWPEDLVLSEGDPHVHAM